MKKLVVVNAGPRNSWNTDSLLSETANGASENGYEVVKFNLFKLDKYTGCISCFGCKKDRFRGRCCCKDGLTPVLDADGLIIGSPNYSKTDWEWSMFNPDLKKKHHEDAFL